MKWQLKAKIQNLVSLLPSSISYSTYYSIQKNFGSLKANQLSPVSRIVGGIETVNRIRKLDRSPVGATFLEIGTGRRINTPIAFWLLGAEKIITVDLNPYLKEELVKLDLEYIHNNKQEIENLFKDSIYEDRLNNLLSYAQSSSNLENILDFLNIQYLAPGDASKLTLPSESIDFHTSYTVLEHIEPKVIKNIMIEGRRILKQDGLFVHKIDYSDHFSHSDKSISPINFLKFSQKEWNKIAGNKYMYMNRLRHDDFINLLTELDNTLLSEETEESIEAVKILKSGRMTLDSMFSNKTQENLSIISSWLVFSKLENLQVGKI